MVRPEHAGTLVHSPKSHQCKELLLAAAHACIHSSLETEQECHEFKSSLVHTVSAGQHLEQWFSAFLTL